MTAGGKYRAAIGRIERSDGPILVERAAALAATLGLDKGPGGGEALPPGWHWIYFNPFVRRGELGHDGHPRRGGFLPDVKLPRRMWAGGRVRYHAKLPVGAHAAKESEIINVAEKSGRVGDLVFVTVRHTISHASELCISEEQDIVYREAPAPDAPRPAPSPAPQGAQWSHMIVPDPVLLFRYSALTYNGHRIHYDYPYATGQEGYRDLVVHGPLIATLLQGLALECCPQATFQEFDYRGVSPIFVDRPFHIEAKTSDQGGLSLWARGPEGELAMTAEATFS